MSCSHKRGKDAQLERFLSSGKSTILEGQTCLNATDDITHLDSLEEVPSKPQMARRAYLGQRLSYDGALCTVRYFGPLEGTTGQWLGVEWDDPNRGKHAGQFKGKPVFACLSPSPTAASFIRPSRKADTPRSFLEALRFKYGTGSEINANGSVPRQRNSAPIEISGKTVEEVGFQKIREQQAVLTEIKIAVLDALNVCGLVAGGESRQSIQKAQGELQICCPRIVELDLGWNPLETLEDIALICAALENIRVLRTSGLRLRDVSLMSQTSRLSPFRTIQQLDLNECLLTAEQLSRLFFNRQDVFPKLSSLSLSANNLTSFPQIDKAQNDNGLETLTTLSLENNLFTSLKPIQAIFDAFPNLKTLSLQGNQIATLGLDSPDSQFPILETLNLSSNAITTYALVDSLPTIFPNLTSLRISNNILYKHSQQTPFYLTLARIPNLKSLNYTNITARDRDEGEIYYLSIAEKDIASLPTEKDEDAKKRVRERYPRYEVLCEKYDRESIFSKSSTASVAATATNQPSYPPGSLGARLVAATFYLPSQEKEFTRPLPTTLNVYILKALVSRTFSLPALQFTLIYESPELDPVREEIGDSKDWDRWGDWDVDDVADELSENETEGGRAGEGEWIDGILYKDGRKWKGREVELLDGFREWGFWLESGVKEARVRVEPFKRVDPAENG